MASRDIHDHEAIYLQPHETCHLVKSAIEKITARHDHGGWNQRTPQSYYTPNPVTGMDPMQILATLAFVAFLLQSLLGLIDRITMTTRVVQARDDTDTLDKRADEIKKSIKKFQAKKWD